MFNPYMAYSYNAQDYSHSCDDKIIVDINRLKNINAYDDVVEYVNKIWGDIEGEKMFDYPNNVQVIIRQKENCIEIGAFKSKKQFFGSGWRLE